MDAITDTLVQIGRKIIRRLNWHGLFVERGKRLYPDLVVAGYTRSGTTYLGRLIANITGWRPVHEPLNPNKVRETSFFNERESASIVSSDMRYRDALRTVFGPGFKGTRYTNTGCRLVYHGRLIKIVRANHYLDQIMAMLDDVPSVVIMRNPCACIASRLHAGWPVPDHSHSIDSISQHLSTAQLDEYRSAGSRVTQLAVSWCLDNLMLLRNNNNQRLLYIYYEDLVLHTETIARNILWHARIDIADSSIKRECRLESGAWDGNAFLQKWRNKLLPGDIDEISRVVSVFGLDGYYDFETGLPLRNTVFLDPILQH